MLLLVSVAEPVYQSPSDHPAPVGSILCVLLASEAVETLAAAVAFRRGSPWAPTVIIGSSSQVAARSLLDHSGSPALWMTPLTDGSLPHAREVTTVVAEQEPPSTASFIAYVTERAGDPVGAAVGKALAMEQPTRGIRSELRRRGPFCLHDWARAHLLLTYLGEATRRGLSQEAVALRYGITPRSLSGWTRHFLGCGWRTAVGLGSWEARLETALRGARYSPDHHNARAASQSA